MVIGLILLVLSYLKSIARNAGESDGDASLDELRNSFLDDLLALVFSRTCTNPVNSAELSQSQDHLSHERILSNLGLD